MWKTRALMTLLLGLISSSAAARLTTDLKPLDGVGIDEKLDAALPLQLSFRNSNGKMIQLQELFDDQRPVILSLNYSDCPMLCQLQLNGLIDGLRDFDWDVGEQFQIVSVSIDPLEQSQRARQTKQRYVKAYGRPQTASGWHFLTGDKAAIDELADAVGFRFKYVPERKEYAHAAAIMVCTPSGRLSRYLYGVIYPPQTLKLALVEAGEGKIGTTLDRVLLFCFHYDAASGRYAPVARRIMQFAASLTLAVILVGLIPSWLRRRRKWDRDDTVSLNKRNPPDQQPILALAPWLFAGVGGSLFPAPTSTGAEQVDNLFYFILAVSVFFFAVIVGVMFLFILRYRERPGIGVEPSASHNNLLELAWTIVPAVIVGVIFFWGFVSYLDMRQPPDDSYEIQVTAKKWSWSFTYPNGHVDNNLHVPEDRPVRLVMSSDDVIHSLYIPAFRLKMDVVPGRYTTTWFEADTPGDYTLFCAEYCGTKHSTMLARVIVHPSGEFAGWLENAANFMDRMTPVEAGQLLYQRRGCVQCHSVDRSAKVGPTFQDVFGTQQLMTDGSTVTVDENYLRESILEPQAKIRAGYKPVMPTYQGQLKDEEIAALIAYIKSVSETKEASP